MTQFVSLVKRLRFSIASCGLRRTTMDVLSHVLAYRADRDLGFDRRYGTDTSGSVATTELGIQDESRRENAILYLPSPDRVTQWMLGSIAIDHRQFTFVDLGCGKGRVILMAAKLPFRKVVGVEISPQLADIAARNIASFPASARRTTIEVANADATAYGWPEGNLLVHLYHPFKPDVTSAVLSGLQAAAVGPPRRIFIAYLLYASAVAEVREVFSRFPWLREVRYEHSLLGQYDWLYFSN